MATITGYSHHPDTKIGEAFLGQSLSSCFSKQERLVPRRADNEDWNDFLNIRGIKNRCHIIYLECRKKAELNFGRGLAESAVTSADNAQVITRKKKCSKWAWETKWNLRRV